MGAIFKRELRSYFTTPIGYVFLAVYLAVNGFAFSASTLEAGVESNIGSYFVFTVFILAIVLPILTMKLFSEERKNGTEQGLLTAPVSISGIVLGKYLAALTMFTIAMTISSFNFVLLFKYAELPLYGDYSFFDLMPLGLIVGNIIGTFFLGAAFIAVGTFISAMTENQISAVILTVLSTCVMVLCSFATEFVSNSFVRVAAKWFSVLERLSSLTNGYLDITTFIYFISFVVVFLFLTGRVYDRRRWA